MVENTPYAVGSEYFWIKKYVVAIVLNEQIKSVKVNELYVYSVCFMKFVCFV